MKHSIYIILAAFIMNACNSKDSSSENKSNELTPVPIEQSKRLRVDVIASH